ncbi:DUF1327 domain-containing protein [Escherichia coli]
MKTQPATGETYPKSDLFNKADKERFDGEIFDLDISLDHVEGAALEFYEAAARRSIRQVFLDVAAGLCEGDELLPETRPCSEARYTIKINSSDNSITGC